MSESTVPLPNPSSQSLAVPRIFPTTGFEVIPPSEITEEENWEWYTPESFYPVRIGDIIHSKYQVLYKVGYGTTSTLWICRDLHHDKYVCMKSMVCDYPSVKREVRAYEVLSNAGFTSDMKGLRYIRQALDHFELEIKGRSYPFLIHEPLGVTVEMLAIELDGLPIEYVRHLNRQMLSALHLIHGAGIVHGDLQTRNILFRIHDEALLQEAEEDEIQHPSPRKVTEQTSVFTTRGYPGPMIRWVGRSLVPVLCDFGEARTGGESYEGLIQPAFYRAPEVFLRLPWGTPADIWNLGCMIWSSMFTTHLFSRTDKLNEQTDEQTADRNQLARMVALLGPPPRQLLEDSGSRALEYFNEDGLPKGDVPHETLESLLASCLEKVGKTMTAEDSAAFLAFIRRTVTWTQETRATTSELLDDPWVSVSRKENS